MKVLKVGAVVEGQSFTKVFSDRVGQLHRACLGSGTYLQQAFPGLIAKVGLKFGGNLDLGRALVTMFAPARVGGRLLVSQDTFEVQDGEPVVAVIGNIDFTFEIVDVG